MDIIFWLVLGAVSGWIASVVMKTNAQQGMILDIVLGVVGAFVGGFLFSLIGQPGVTGFNIYSFVVAIIGATALIFIGRTFQRQSSI